MPGTEHCPSRFPDGAWHRDMSRLDAALEHVPAHLDREGGAGSEPANALPLLALATGSVEEVLEIALLRHDLLAKEGKPIHVEQPAHVMIGERPRVRGVAGPLEAIDLERAQGIGRSQLIDHEQAPVWPGDAHELGESSLGATEVMERADRTHDVETPRLERQREDVALDEADVRQTGSQLLRLGQELGHDVATDNLADERCQPERQRARPGARIENALVTAKRRQQPCRALADQRRLLACPLSEMLRS